MISLKDCTDEFQAAAMLENAYDAARDSGDFQLAAGLAIAAALYRVADRLVDVRDEIRKAR